MVVVFSPEFSPPSGSGFLSSSVVVPSVVDPPHRPSSQSSYSMEPLEQEMSSCPQPSQREEGATMPSSKRQSRSRLLSQFSEHSLHAPQLPQVAVEFHPEVELQGAAPPAAAILSSIQVRTLASSE